MLRKYSNHFYLSDGVIASVRIVIRTRFVLFFALFFSLSLISYSQQLNIDSLRSRLKKGGNDTTTLKTLNELAWQFFLVNNFDSAMHYAGKSMLLAEKLIAETKGIEQVTAKKNLGRANQTIGDIYFSQGDYTEALKYQLAGLKTDEAINYLHGIASIYNNISNIYIVLRNNTEALKNHEASLKIYEELGDKQAMGNSYNNISIFYVQQRNYSEALKNQEMALQIRKELGDKLDLATSYGNLGVIFDSQGRYQEALKNQMTSLKIAQEIKNKKSIAHAYSNIGADYLGLGKFKDATECLEKAILAGREVNDKESLKSSYYTLTKAYQQADDYKSAFESQKHFIDLTDSLLNEESSKQIAEMKTKFETEKEEKEIELQRHTIEKQNLSRNYILTGFALFVAFSVISFFFYNQKKKVTFLRKVSEIEMKALRAQMNPHFTFNVLNSIQYYISKNEIKAARQYLTKFSRLIRMILDQSRSSYIALDEEIAMLKLYLDLEEMRFEEEFKYSIEVDEGLNPGDILIPGMMIQPVVENAIKYGVENKKGDAVIKIQFLATDSTLRCIVTDNGIGRLEAEKMKTNGNEHKSAATSIINERIKDMGFIFNIELVCRTEDLFEYGKPAGTRVFIEMPLQVISS